MGESDAERTETPTPRRRTEAREEGNVAKSPDLTAACILLASILLLDLVGPRIMAGVKQVTQAMLSGALVSQPAQPTDLGSNMMFGGHVVVSAMVPFVLSVVVVTMAALICQVGFLLTPKPLQPSFSKINPLKGLKNLFGARGGMRLVMSLAKVIVIAMAAAIIIIGDLPQAASICALDVRPICSVSWALLYWLGIKLALVLVVLALLDFAYQRWQGEQDMRMTKQEVREEMKRMEGDPLVKQRRARVGRQLAMQRVTQAVPKADVVVTNPTHFAIALRYDAQKMSAPTVIAKGADYMALRIRQLAIMHGVPMVERKTLAKALYSTVEIGQEVPPQFFGAVAEILAYVYRLSGRKTA